MKKALKIIGISFMVLIGISSIGRIAKSAMDISFEGQIRKANQDCPIPVANGAGQVSSISLDGKMLVYKIDYTPEYFNIEAYKNNPEATRDMLYLTFICLNGQGGHGDQLISKLQSEKCGVRFIFSNGTASRTSEMTPEYMEEMRRKIELNPSEALHNALILKLEVEKNEYPVQADEGMLLTGLELEGNNVVINALLDENIYDITAFNGYDDEFAQTIIDEANAGDVEIGALLDLCKVSHSGISYRMKGDQSKKQYDLTISSEKIRSQRKTPPQIKLQ